MLHDDRYLEVTAKRSRWSTVSTLSHRPSSATGNTVSKQTVYRHSGHKSVYARRRVRCVSLMATRRRQQLACSKERALWTLQQWACIMFSWRIQVWLAGWFTLNFYMENTRYPWPSKEHRRTTPFWQCRIARLRGNCTGLRKYVDRPSVSGHHSGTTCMFVAG